MSEWFSLFILKIHTDQDERYNHIILILHILWPAGVGVAHLLEVAVEAAGEGAVVPEVVGHGHAEQALVAEHPGGAGLVVVVKEELVEEPEEEGAVLVASRLQLGVLDVP